ncbi:hypothetical protein FDP41_005042 [Naegleria fowleri]|uniref:Guanylate cyclase domain-containing protein n=1 Tax=Naegleria fowleri TaxID=5763 RepID=A0A6A5BQJ7_NAEFO|nr:uncharacterized protein FDP41_005042 [Naegleria fowleri]KAF0975715.1 hypothetical protein FDP41_005042 [Naegleria fowleri]
MNGLQEGNVDDDPTTTTIKNTTTNWIVPSRSPESSAWSNAEFGSRSHGSQLELGLLHHSKMNGSSSPPSSCPSNPMNTSIEMSVPIHAHQDEEAFPSSQGDENTLKHSLQKGSSVKKEASHHHHSSKYSSSIKTLLLHAVESIPSSLITVMNVLVIFFLLQSLITIGTTFFILFFEGSTLSDNAELVAHQDRFQKLIRNLYDFVIPAEIVTSSLHNQVLSFIEEPSSHNSWARLLSTTSVYDRQLSFMYFGDGNNQVTMLRQINGVSNIMVPCHAHPQSKSLNAVQDVITKDFDLTFSQNCPKSHLKYNVSSDGVILIEQGVANVQLDLNVSSKYWFTSVANNFPQISSEVPKRQKYTAWSDVFLFNGALSIYVSLLVRDSTNNFVGVAALEYSLSDLQVLLCNLVATSGGAILVLDREDRILGACALLSDFSFTELSSTMIQTFPKDFSNNTLFESIFKLMNDEETHSSNQSVTFSDALYPEPQLKGMIHNFIYSISEFSMNNLRVKVIVITEHTGFLSIMINSRVSSLVILFLVVGLGIVFLMIVLKGITYPFQRLRQTMENILKLDHSLSIPVHTECLLGDVRRMQSYVETFRNVLFYFSLFCPELIVKHILASSSNQSNIKAGVNDQIIPTKSQYMTILVLELKNFCDLQQRIGMDMFCRVLNSFISELTSSIHSNEGFVFDLSVKNNLKIMALWNDSTKPIENHELRAAATAIEMQTIMADKIEHIKQEFNCPCVEIDYKTVIATGMVFLACTGTTTSRVSFSCFGESVAVCDVLLEHCRSGEVLLCQNVFVKVAEMFLCHYLRTVPIFTMKQEKRDVVMYSLKKYLKESSAYEQHVASKLLQLRDRRRELDIAEVSTDTLYKSLCKELQNLGHEVNADND